ncbi:substrate-binding periplasmic protein [Geoanaerobacter pelophilus]|nr:transporter substrate-binding domain-containing protein [Geoanaerobacter pelophilus]
MVTLEYPPYEYSEDGVIKGAAVEIVREAFKLMGHEVIIEILPFARSIEMLKNGDADGIFTFFRTPERESFAFFSQEAVVQQRISLWVRKDSKITFDGNLTSLKDYRFGVVRKTSYGERFDGAVKKGTLKIAESYTIEEAIKLLVNGRVDIWVSNHDGAVFELKKIGQSKEVKELLPSLQNIPAYVGFSRKRNLEGLRNDFDAALRTLKKSGKYAIILKGYSH